MFNLLSITLTHKKKIIKQTIYLFLLTRRKSNIYKLFIVFIFITKMSRVHFCPLKIASVHVSLHETEIRTSRGLLSSPRAKRARNKKDFLGKSWLVDPITDQRDTTWMTSVWQYHTRARR